LKPFWEAVNDFLGYAPPEKDGDPWTQLLNVTAGGQLTPLIEGIQPSQPGALPPNDPTLSPFYQRSDDVNRLVELTPQPFQTIDINPADYALAFDNRCVIDKGILANLFGQDGASGSAIDEGGPWRTVVIPLTGTFLKFEYNQAGRNAYTVVGAGRSPTSTQIGKFFPYLGALGASSPGDYQQNSERGYLLQYNVTNAPPLALKDGDTFEAPFATLYISFKTLAAPFRIIVGNKSVIRSTDDHRLMNSNIAFGPGLGVWENTGYHAVPFCMTIDNFQDSSFVTNITQGAANKLWTLITNDNTQSIATRPCPTGTAVLWITEFLFYSVGISSAATSTLALIKTNTSNSNVVQTIYETALTIGGTANPPVYYNPNFPSRILLYQQEALEIFLNTGSTSASIHWMVKGYILGGLIAPAQQSYNQGGRNFRRGYINGSFGAFPRVVFDMDPYPFDNSSGTSLF